MAKNRLPAVAVKDFHNAERTLTLQAERLHEEAARATALARVYIEVRALMDEASIVWDRLKSLRDKLAYEWVPDAFEAEQLKTLNLKEGYRVTISALVRASTRDMEKGIEWMRKNGYEDVPKLTINASTLTAIARSLAEKNEQLPEDLFNVFFGNNTSITRVQGG